jgi:hypothetical protein
MWIWVPESPSWWHVQDSFRALLALLIAENWTLQNTHLIFRFRQSYLLPVTVLKRIATSCIIVELLDALSHVMWPVCNPSMSARSHTISWHRIAYLVRDANPFDNFKQGLTQPLTIVSIVNLREAEKATFELPLCRCCFLNPVTSNCKIAVCVFRLPCITCQIDFPSDRRTLDSIRR